VDEFSFWLLGLLGYIRILRQIRLLGYIRILRQIRLLGILWSSRYLWILRLLRFNRYVWIQWCRRYIWVLGLLGASRNFRIFGILRYVWILRHFRYVRILGGFRLLWSWYIWLLGLLRCWSFGILRLLGRRSFFGNRHGQSSCHIPDHWGGCCIATVNAYCARNFPID
jgi:hypothetical protein